MTRRPVLAALALACVSATTLPLLPAPAYAAAEVAQVGNTAVTIPVGTWIAGVLPDVAAVAVTILSGFASAALARVAPWAALLISQRRIEATVQTAVAYGLNAVEGAAKGQQLTIPVGSAVIAQALQRIIDSTPAKVIDAAGGLPELGARIFRSLDLEPDSTAAKVLEPALRNLGVAAR